MDVSIRLRLPSYFALTPRRRKQLWYAPLLATAMGLMFVRLLVMARMFDVPAFAEYSAALLISNTYCMVGCLGLQTMLLREWPAHLVRLQRRRAVVRAAQCNLVALLSAGLGCLFAAGTFSIAGQASVLLAVGVLHGLSQQMFMVATTESRSRGDALGYSRQQVVRAALSLAFGAWVAFGTKSPLATIAVEVVVSMALTTDVFNRALARAAIGWRAAHALAWRRMSRVAWLSAATLMATSLVAFAVLNADRWVASQMLDQVGFAQYSFVAILLAMAQSLQALINASVFPLLSRRYAGHGAIAAYDVCRRSALALLLIGLVALIPSVMLLEAGITRWYPQYVQAVALLPLLGAVGVLRLSDLWSSFLIVAGHERVLLVVQLCAVVCATLAWLLWLAPWEDSMSSLQDIGLLAAFLGAFSYVATAVAARCLRSR